MKKLFIITESLSDKITYYHLALFLVSLPFDSLYSRVILLSLAIHTALHIKKQQLKKLRDKNIYFLSGLYFVSLFSAMYTINVDEALFDLTKELGILIFPLIFALTTFDLGKYKRQLLILFSATCLITVIFLFLDALQIIRFYQLPVSFLFSNSFINHHFSQPIEMHATYFSMYVGFSLFFFLECFLAKKGFVRRTVLLILVLILLAALIQLASRSVFIAVILTICVAFPFFAFQGRPRVIFLATIVFVLAGVLIVVLNNDALKTRYLNEFKSDLDASSLTEGRFVRWEAIGELIKKKPYFGYGTGSETQILKKQYLEKKLYTSYYFGLNTHNQFLGFFLRTGIIGLLIYLLTVAFGFYKAINSRDILFLGFMIIITITSVSENILDINKGIFFYSFFFPFFVFSDQKPEMEKTTNTLPLF